MALTAARRTCAGRSSPTLTTMSDDRPPGGAPAPPFPDALLAEAAANAGGRVYAIDPAYDADGEVPPEGIVGAWRIGEDGRPSGEYRANPNHRPATER